MKFQLAGPGWPVGQFLIPGGTIIDSGASDSWSTLVRGLSPPVSAIPLDQGTYQQMKNLYGGSLDHFRYVISGPGILR
jgi:hypothetical protein